jgi:hypothetical protein
MTNQQNLASNAYNRILSNEFDLEGSVFPNIKALAESILNYHDNRMGKNSPYVIHKRGELSKFAKKFHIKAIKVARPNNKEILESIDSKINILSKFDPSNVILLMSAHQPNLFPYSGVTRKIALMVALRKIIENMFQDKKELKDTVCLFGIADHDFVHNKWIRSAELPAPLRREGILRYNIKIPEKDIMLPANKIRKPPPDTIDSWKTLTRNWLAENLTIAEKYLKRYSPDKESDSIKPKLEKNEEEFWSLADRAYSASETIAEFNSILLYLASLEIFEEPILFANFSECFTILHDEYSWFMDCEGIFSEVIKNNEVKLKSAGFDSGLAEDIADVFPLWLKCDCGSKYRLVNNSGTIVGRCKRCGSVVSYTVQELKELIQRGSHLFEPRSIAMPIAFTKAFDISCYIGGIGGLGYLAHSRKISNRLRSPLPPTPFWYVDDTFISLELLCAAYEVRRLAKQYSVAFSMREDYLSPPLLEDACSNIISAIDSGTGMRAMRKNPEVQRDKQMLENIKTSLKTKGCLIDNAINIGMRSNFKQWIVFLLNDGRLQIPVQINTMFRT